MGIGFVVLLIYLHFSAKKYELTDEEERSIYERLSVKEVQTIIYLLLVLCASCSKQVVLDEPPLQYSFMPNYLDFDTIVAELPKTPEDMVELDSLEYFKQFPIDSGEVSSKFGILISERKAGEYIFYKAGYERIQKELDMSEYLRKEYYDKSLAAEKLYQQRIVDLKKKAKRSWLEKNIGYIGFITGLATAIITEFAVIKANH